MLLHLILPLLLMLGALLYVVPAVTDGGVAIRKNSAARGFLALLVIALVNNIFFHVLIILGVSLSLPLTMLKLGLAGWLTSSLGILVCGRIMPGVLYVRSFWTALGASLVLIVVGWLIAVSLF